MSSSIYEVVQIINENTIQVNPRWNYFDEYGKYVRIFGLMPINKNNRQDAISEMANLLIGKKIKVKNACYILNGILVAIIYIENKPLVNYFPDRAISPNSLNLWNNPDKQKMLVNRERCNIDLWINPFSILPSDCEPYFRSFGYPTKNWEYEFTKKKNLAESIYSPTQNNLSDLEKSLKKVFLDTERVGNLIIQAEAGIGKSWYIRHTLLGLPKDKFDVIIIDMHFLLNGENLIQSINNELEQFFDADLLRDLKWLYPKMANLYGRLFSPNDPKQNELMVEYSLSLNIQERIYYKLNYYRLLPSRILIICFDNIDQLSEKDQELLVDYCRRLTGGITNVKIIYSIRSNLMAIKSALTDSWGDNSIKIINFESPDIYDVLERRLTHNSEGNSWSLESKIPNSTWTYRELLEEYKKSDNNWGLAGFIRNLCTTSSISQKTNYPSSSIIPDNHRYNVDLRRYIKLFSRILKSKSLQDFSNIGNLYYGIEALLISNEENLQESESYLFNLFDNENPLEPGNTLIRFRVLEYFNLFTLIDETFDIYFDALGYGAENAHFLVGTFVDADLINVSTDPQNQKTYGRLTIAGIRQLELAQNPWYILSIKNRIPIYEDYIKYGSDAIESAKKIISSKSLLDYYGKHGWVTEIDFINFIADQVISEAIRLNNFLENHNRDRDVKMVLDMYQNVAMIHENLFYSIHYHNKMWESGKVG